MQRLCGTFSSICFISCRRYIYVFIYEKLAENKHLSTTNVLFQLKYQMIESIQEKTLFGLGFMLHSTRQQNRSVTLKQFMLSM